MSEGAGTVLVCATVREQPEELDRDLNIKLSVENGNALGEYYCK